MLGEWWLEVERGRQSWGIARVVGDRRGLEVMAEYGEEVVEVKRLKMKMLMLLLLMLVMV